MTARTLTADDPGPNIARPMQRPTAVPLLAAAVSGLFCLAIDRYWFDGPWGNWHQPMRDWGLHWIALVCATMTTMLLLQRLSDGSREAAVRGRRIALTLPLTVASLHEGGQWMWPSGHRDPLDCGRDLALNILGAIVAWAILARWSPLPDSTPRKKRATEDRGE